MVDRFLQATVVGAAARNRGSLTFFLFKFVEEKTFSTVQASLCESAKWIPCRPLRLLFRLAVAD